MKAKIMTLTPLDLRALHVLRENPGCPSQDLATYLGIKRTYGGSLHAQGAGRLGAAKGMRLVQMGLADKKLVHGGYCYGFWLTPLGQQTIKAGA